MGNLWNGPHSTEWVALRHLRHRLNEWRRRQRIWAVLGAGAGSSPKVWHFPSGRRFPLLAGFADFARRPLSSRSAYASECPDLALFCLSWQPGLHSRFDVSPISNVGDRRAEVRPGSRGARKRSLGRGRWGDARIGRSGRRSRVWRRSPGRWCRGWSCSCRRRWRWPRRRRRTPLIKRAPVKGALQSSISFRNYAVFSARTPVPSQEGQGAGACRIR